MIFNLGGNSKSAITADTVEYGNSNVAQALDSLEAKDVSLTNSVSVIEDELTANGTRIYLDYQNGQYGYNTSATRGADTFSPFKSGINVDKVACIFYSNSSGDRSWTVPESGDYLIIMAVAHATISDGLRLTELAFSTGCIINYQFSSTNQGLYHANNSISGAEYNIFRLYQVYVPANASFNFAITTNDSSGFGRMSGYVIKIR